MPPITAPTPMVDDLEELVAREPVGRGVRLRVRLGLLRGRGRGSRRGVLGRDVPGLGQVRVCGQVAHPEECEHQRDDRAERGDVPGDDDPDEQHDDADREADRPEARARNVRVFVVALGQDALGGIQAFGTDSGQRRNRRREL